jgi:hypothetical protein
MVEKLHAVHVPLRYAPFTCCLCAICLPKLTASRFVDGTTVYFVMCRNVLSNLEWMIMQNGLARCVLSFIVGAVNSNREGAEPAFDLYTQGGTNIVP